MYDRGTMPQNPRVLERLEKEINLDLDIFGLAAELLAIKIILELKACSRGRGGIENETHTSSYLSMEMRGRQGMVNSQ